MAGCVISPPGNQHSAVLLEPGLPADGGLSSLDEKAFRLGALIQNRHLTPEGLLAYGVTFDSPDMNEMTGMASPRPGRTAKNSRPTAA